MQRGSAVKSVFKNKMIGLTCVAVLSAAGCATVTSPVQVEPLPDSEGKAQMVSFAPQSVQTVADRRIGDALDQMRELVESVEPGKLGLRAQVVSHHNFAQGVALKDLFAKNGLFVRFDPTTLGSRPTEAPLFIAAVGDLLSYLEDVLGLYVRVEGAGTFVVSECKEIVYNVPANASEYFRPTDLSLIMSHPDARVSYLKVGKLYVYDDRIGHYRISEYIKGVENLIRNGKTLHPRSVPSSSDTGSSEDASFVSSWSRSRNAGQDSLDDIVRRLTVIERRLDEKSLDMQLSDLRSRLVALERRLSETASASVAFEEPSVNVDQRMKVEVARKIRKDPPLAQSGDETKTETVAPQKARTKETGQQAGDSIASSSADNRSKPSVGEGSPSFASGKAMNVFVGSFHTATRAKKVRSEIAEKSGEEPKIMRVPDGDDGEWYVLYYRVDSVDAGKDLMERLSAVGVESYMRPAKR